MQGLPIESDITAQLGEGDVAMTRECSGETFNGAVRQQLFARVELRHGERELPRQLLRLAHSGRELRRERRTQANVRGELLLLTHSSQLANIHRIRNLPAEAARHTA